jgi:FdhE protein
MAVADERFSLLDRHLAALRQSRPELAQALDLQAQLVRTRLSSPRPAEAQPFALPREHAAARLRAGVPLLHDQPAHLDIQFAADLFRRLIQVFRQRAEPALQVRLDGIERVAISGQLDSQRLFGEAFVNHADHLADHALELGVDPELLTRLARLAVAPLLRAYADRLVPVIERIEDESIERIEDDSPVPRRVTPAAGVWRRGYCPVCGGWPIVGELDGDADVQVLRCGACGSGWDAQRQACPYCGNDDLRQLRTPSAAGEDRVRIAACDRCNGYLEVGNAVDPTLPELPPELPLELPPELPPELLALDDVASGHLDRLAAEAGYRRPDGSGFRIELAVPEEEWLDELGED